TASAKRYEVSPEPGYREPLNLWLCPAMGPGNRRTAVVNESIAPISAWEAEQGEKLAPQIRRAHSERKTSEAVIERLRRQAAKPGQDNDELLSRISDIEERLPEIPVVPRLYADDVTPEQLAAIMAQNQERIAIFSDEAGVFDMMAGRYS